MWVITWGQKAVENGAVGGHRDCPTVHYWAWGHCTHEVHWPIFAINPSPSPTHFVQETRDTTTRLHNVNEDENQRDGRALVTVTDSSGHKQKVQQGPF